jgi:hypothetical protein
MSNMMPGDNSGAEPAEHERLCRVNCPHNHHTFDADRGIEMLINAAARLSWWKPGKSEAIVEDAKRMFEDALALIECPSGHRSHDCNCDDLAEIDAEDAAYWPGGHEC